ncbi:DUF4190 domain-containing protein [Streptomyces sp. NPDC059639]|uniref:DUF4190 domain-containing protein n=1 Tax=Streptomyces sp. NPDC059639 TaxID=3346891 RepID=UPI0036A110CB
MTGGSTPQDRDPWAPPQDAPAAPSLDKAPDLHDRQTVTAMPLVPGPQPSPPPAPAPYAPPPAPQDHSPVPPPPISPEGPGQPLYGAQPPGPGQQYAHPGAQYGYPGPQYGYPAAQQHPAPYGGAQNYGYWPGAMPAQPSNGLGIAAMVLGIVSDVFFLMWPIAIICGILAVIFGTVGRGRAKRGEATNPGQALTGIICGSVGLVLSIGFVVLIVATV